VPIAEFVEDVDIVGVIDAVVVEDCALLIVGVVDALGHAEADTRDESETRTVAEMNALTVTARTDGDIEGDDELEREEEEDPLVRTDDDAERAAVDEPVKSTVTVSAAEPVAEAESALRGDEVGAPLAAAEREGEASVDAVSVPLGDPDAVGALDSSPVRVALKNGVGVGVATGADSDTLPLGVTDALGRGLTENEALPEPDFETSALRVVDAELLVDGDCVNTAVGDILCPAERLGDAAADGDGDTDALDTADR